MSKIYILKENPPENFVLMDITPNDCVPVDIDRELLEYEIYREHNRVRDMNGEIKLQISFKPFSEYLQERMQ